MAMGHSQNQSQLTEAYLPNKQQQAGLLQQGHTLSTQTLLSFSQFLQEDVVTSFLL
jgi:hypothetical protein